jgi:GNAT superfamily N-acetyltransferase
MRKDEAAERYPTPAAPSLSVKPEDPSLPECVLLFRHLWEALGQLYGNTGPCEFSPADVQGPGAEFVVARLDGRPIGCGAILPLAPGVAEVKRMFVEPCARRQGIAGRILRELENVACRSGYAVIRIETGIRQAGAIRLYAQAGYRRVERHGSHSDGELSVCFEKRIEGRGDPDRKSPE